MSFCRSRCLVRNEHFHLLCGRFSLLLLLLLLSLWPAGEDQGEQACEKALLLVLRCWLLRSRSLCSWLYAIGGRRLWRGVEVSDWRGWGRGGECLWFNQLLSSLYLSDGYRRFLSRCFRLLLHFLWLKSKGFPLLRYEYIWEKSWNWIIFWSFI